MRASRPLIAVVADAFERNGLDGSGCLNQYVRAARESARCDPVIVPLLDDDSVAESTLSHCDGLMLTGARSNMHPSRYGDLPSPAAEPYDERRDASSLALVRTALARRMPTLAICRGMQDLNVALDGTLRAAIETLPERMNHRRRRDADNPEVRFALEHDVNVAENGLLRKILNAERVRVNSMHGQAIETLGRGLRVEARADDDVIEAISLEDADFVLGVQWHPEFLSRSDAPSRRLFEAFGDAARVGAERRRH